MQRATLRLESDHLELWYRGFLANKWDHNNAGVDYSYTLGVRLLARYWAPTYVSNRVTTKAGGDAAGGNLRQASYSANALNQYSSRTVPGAVDVLGLANRSATVTVNGQSAYRRNEFYHSVVTLNNSAGPVWAAISANAALGGTNGTRSGNIFLPAATENCTYDLDGNLTQDGRWNYSCESLVLHCTNASK